MNGRTPRLIELQGFPSLYAFQFFLLALHAPRFPAIPRDERPVLHGLNDDSYLDLFREVIVGEADPENVILLDDRAGEAEHADRLRLHRDAPRVRPGQPNRLRKRGGRLFYERDGREVRIERIYNRVIFDELLRRPDLSLGFNFQDDLDVTWVGHPNWYFRISKHSLPFLKTDTYFAGLFCG